MKKLLLLFACIITLLATNGCLVAEDGRHGHSEVFVPIVPVVAVHSPEIIVR